MARKLCKHCQERPAGLNNTVCWECRDELMRSLRPVVQLSNDPLYGQCANVVYGKYGAFSSGYRRKGAHREG